MIVMMRQKKLKFFSNGIFEKVFFINSISQKHLRCYCNIELFGGHYLSAITLLEFFDKYMFFLL